MQAVLAQPMEPVLHELLSDRVVDAIACGYEHQTHIIICEPGDTEADFLRAAAFSPPLSGWLYGDACFQPLWDWAARHDGWFEWLSCIGKAGFAFILLVPDSEDIDPTLLAIEP
ncbi:hypothetical protein [Sphingobium fontiphilum]|nr:hypothetical protein [Sphingobium fontiphilum]